MAYTRQESVRKLGLSRAIKMLRSAGDKGLTTAQLCERLDSSDTTAKSYMRALHAAKCVKIVTVKVAHGTNANCAILTATSAQLAAFLAGPQSGKTRQQRGTGKKRDKAPPPSNYFRFDYSGSSQAPAPSKRVYADLPASFFGDARAVA